MASKINPKDPNFAWDKLKIHQKVEEIKLVDPSTPKKDGHTRFVCISDTHNKTSNLLVPDGDVLIHAGDFTGVGHRKEVQVFKDFILTLPHPNKIIIAGNHDITFDEESYPKIYSNFGHKEPYNSQEIKDMIAKEPSITYLEDSGCTINGISIWGSPWQPTFCNWGFNLDRGEPLQKKWDLIPEDTDVLITHGPPIGHGDLCFHGGRAGCVDLLQTIQGRVKPQYHVFGHIHEGYGVTTDGNTIYVNASTCNIQYRPINKPVVFDIPNKP